MDDNLTVIAGLEPEQALERAAALAFEIAYWQQILTEAEKINTGVHDSAAAILETVSAALELVTVAQPNQLASIEKVLEQSRKALEALQTIGDGIGGCVELAAGRQAALEPVAATLRRIAGLEPRRDDESPQP